MELYVDLIRKRRVAIPEEPGVFRPMHLGPVPRIRLRPEDPPPTAEELYNDGYGIALYCEYFLDCLHDSSERLFKCDVCEVACCVERCLKDALGMKICTHCSGIWSDEALRGSLCRRH